MTTGVTPAKRDPAECQSAKKARGCSPQDRVSANQSRRGAFRLPKPARASWSRRVSSASRH